MAQKKQVFLRPYILTMLLFSAVLHTEDSLYLRSRESSIVNFLRTKLVESPRPSISFFSLFARMFRRHSHRAKKEEGGRKGTRRFFPQRCAREEKKPRPKL